MQKYLAKQALFIKIESAKNLKKSLSRRMQIRHSQKLFLIEINNIIPKRTLDMMGTATCMLVGSMQDHEALSYHLLVPRLVVVTAVVVRPFSSWLPYVSVLPILSPILPLTTFP